MAATDKFKIDKFTAKLKHGGSRANLFQVEINKAPSRASAGEDNFKYMCKASGIPASTIGTYEVPYFGRTIKFAGDREFTELSTTVINDEDYKMRNFIESWMAALNSNDTNETTLDFGTRKDYTSDIKLQTYKKAGKSAVDQAWKFIGCWPSALSSTDLNWDSTNAIQEFTVTWQYDYYEHKPATT